MCAKQHKAFPHPHLGHIVLVGTVEALHVPWSKHAALLELGLILGTSEAVWVIIWGTTWGKKKSPNQINQMAPLSSKSEDRGCYLLGGILISYSARISFIKSNFTVNTLKLNSICYNENFHRFFREYWPDSKIIKAGHPHNNIFQL